MPCTLDAGAANQQRLWHWIVVFGIHTRSGGKEHAQRNDDDEQDDGKAANHVILLRCVVSKGKATKGIRQLIFTYLIEALYIGVQ